MKFFDMTWMDVERYLETDDRVVLPLGSTEQHAYLSLGVDAILAERVAVEAAAPLAVPVLPAMPFGLVPYFAAFPGSPSLRVDTYLAVVRDLLDSLHAQGFNRFLIVNGHGGNSPAAGIGPEWMGRNPRGQVRFHNWWNGQRTWEVVQRLDPDAGHASWLESFPWTRLPGVEAPPEGKPMIDMRRLAVSGPNEVRELLEDGSYGGRYQRSDEEMLEMWQTGVDEVRELLESGWR